MATRAILRTRARIRADQTDATFPTDTEYNYLLDEAAKEAWYDLISAGWPINFTTADKALAANPITLGFSGTVAFIRGVFYLNGGRYTDIPRIQEGDRAGLLAGSGRPAGYDVRIDATVGPVLEILPPQSSGSVRIEYIVEHPGFAGESTEWYGPARSDEMIVLRAAAKGCRKEGNDQGADQLDNEYAMLLEKVQTMAGWFNMRHGAKIRDVGDQFTSRAPDGSDYDVY